MESPLHHGNLSRRGPRVVLPVTGALVIGALVTTIVISAAARLTSEQIIRPLTDQQVLAGPLSSARVVPANVEPKLTDARALSALYDGCQEQLGSSLPTPCTFGGTWDEVDVVVMGDSHAAHWFDAVQRAVQPGTTTAYLTQSSCPLFNGGEVESPTCAEWRDQVLADIRQAAPRLVVLSNYTSGYGSSSTQESVKEGWMRSLAELSARNVVVLGDVPIPPGDVPRCLSRHVDDALRCAFTPNTDQRQLHVAEQEAVEASGAQWLDTWPWLCDSTCSVLAGNTMLWRDASGHLTPQGSRLLAPRLREVLSRAPVSGAS